MNPADTIRPEAPGAGDPRSARKPFRFSSPAATLDNRSENLAPLEDMRRRHLAMVEDAARIQGFDAATEPKALATPKAPRRTR